MHELLLFQGFQEFFGGSGRVLQSLSLALHRPVYLGRCQIQESIDELIGVLCFNPVTLEDVGGEVVQVEGHDHVGTSSDRRCEDVPIIRVRQYYRLDQVFIVLYEAIPRMRVHQVPSAF